MNKDKKYYEGLDKRTTEYKAYARFNKLGNEPKEFTKKQLKESTFKHTLYVDLNQTERKPKEILRPFKRDQYEAYKKYKETRTLDVWKPKDIDLLINLYAHVFALQHDKNELNKESKGSFKKLATISKELDLVFESYERLNK